MRGEHTAMLVGSGALAMSCALSTFRFEYDAGTESSGASGGMGGQNNQGGTTVGGVTATGGSTQTAGGATAAGGTYVGGSVGNGGTNVTGSSLPSGGTSSTGGTRNTGGTTSNGGTHPLGGSATGGSKVITGGVPPVTGGRTSTGGGSAIATGGISMPTSGRTNTGGAGTGGITSTGGTANTGAMVVPRLRTDSQYSFTLTSGGVPVEMDVNPDVAGRVSSLTIGAVATNIIQPYACAGSYTGDQPCNHSGSTFWTSPQSSWGGTPVPSIDGKTDTVTDSGSVSGHLMLTGILAGEVGASVNKDFSANAATGWFTITYAIKAAKSIQVAPWQVTRVPRGGLVFFPLVSLLSNNINWALSPSGGYEWIDDTNQTSVASSDGSKVIADGGLSGQSYTWLAYALSGNLFLIKYPDVNASSFAPGEGDTEVYPGSGYLELSAQGAYTALATNGTLSWTVQWFVVPIPSNVTAAAGSASLISFVQQQVGG